MLVGNVTTPTTTVVFTRATAILDPEAAIPQIMDSAISIELMERNYPGLSRIISDQKNTGNYLKNLADFLLGPA